MKLIKPSFDILQFDDNKLIERAGRTCYKSEDKIAEGTDNEFATRMVKNGHEAMLEFGHATVKIICDRGVTHEIVRHRLFSYAQESTRYCNYKSGVTFVIPPWLDVHIVTGDDVKIPTGVLSYPDIAWLTSCRDAESIYLNLLKQGWTPQQARAVLPNSLKTEIICKANFREWRHFFKMRDAAAAHPQMREIATPMHAEFKRRNPYVFQ